jgi:hypothetical protein
VTIIDLGLAKHLSTESMLTGNRFTLLYWYKSFLGWESTSTPHAC